MALKYRKKLILAKIEATAGTAETLAASDAILAKDIEITPLAGDTVSRDLQYSYYGNAGDIQVNAHQQITFKVELVGSGTAGTAPTWGRLLQACGLAETITTASKVDYTPVSEGEKTLTIGLNIDGQLHTLHGARGTYSIEMSVNQIAYLNFTFTGLWNDPTSVAPVANPIYTGFKLPLISSNTNTPTFSLFGNSALALSAFTYDHANEVVHRELIGADNEVIITDRAPTGNLTLDAPKLSALNLIKKAKDGDDGALQLVHGTADGKIIEINAPKVRLSGPSYQEADGVMQLQLSLAMLPNTGNDEIKLTAR